MPLCFEIDNFSTASPCSARPDKQLCNSSLFLTAPGCRGRQGRPDPVSGPALVSMALWRKGGLELFFMKKGKKVSYLKFPLIWLNKIPNENKFQCLCKKVMRVNIFFVKRGVKCYLLQCNWWQKVRKKSAPTFKFFLNIYLSSNMALAAVKEI